MAKRYRRKDNLGAVARSYAASRNLDFLEFNDGIHLRLVDDSFTTMDIWPTTGRYYILRTNYVQQSPDKAIAERGGEKNNLPYGDDAIFAYLDRIFYATEM